MEKVQSWLQFKKLCRESQGVLLQWHARRMQKRAAAQRIIQQQQQQHQAQQLQPETVITTASKQRQRFNMFIISFIELGY